MCASALVSRAGSNHTVWRMRIAKAISRPGSLRSLNFDLAINKFPRIKVGEYPLDLIECSKDKPANTETNR